MRGTLAASLFLFILGIVFWFMADQLPRSPLAGPVGADGLPKLLGIGLAVLSIALGIQTYLEMRKTQQTNASAAVTGKEREDGETSHLKAFGLLGIGVLYIVLLPVLGYAVTAAATFAAVATYAGLKPSFRTVAFAVGAAAVYYVLFVRILQIPLPSGFWPALFG